MHMKVECPPLLVFNEFSSSLLQHCINFIVFFHTEIIRCRIGVEAVSIKHKLNSFDVHALSLAKSFHELQRRVSMSERSGSVHLFKPTVALQFEMRFCAVLFFNHDIYVNGIFGFDGWRWFHIGSIGSNWSSTHVASVNGGRRTTRKYEKCAVARERNRVQPGVVMLALNALHWCGAATSRLFNMVPLHLFHRQICRICRPNTDCVRSRSVVTATADLADLSSGCLPLPVFSVLLELTTDMLFIGTF